MRVKKTGRTEKDKPASRARGVRKPTRSVAADRKATAGRGARKVRTVRAAKIVAQTNRPMAALAQAMFEASARPALLAEPPVATPRAEATPVAPVNSVAPVTAVAPVLLVNAAPSQAAAPLATPSQSRSWIGLAALTGCAASATFVILLMGRPSLAPADVSKAESLRAEDMPLTVPSPVARPKETPVRTEVKKPEPRLTASLPPPRTVAPSESLAPAPAPVMLPASAPPPLPKLMAAAEPAAAHPAASTAATSSAAVSAGTVTITGCLDTNKDGFRLNNTSGADAPQSRSWKTGFFKKRSASISLEDAGRSGLSSHIGELVSITGILEDRDMQVHSVRRLAGSCE